MAQSVSELVKAARAEHGNGSGQPMSLRYFGYMLGVSFQTIKNWEDGTSAPSLETLFNLRKSLTEGEWPHGLVMDILAILLPEVYPQQERPC